MKDRRGIVVDISGQTATLLIPGGKFLTIRTSRPVYLGQELSLPRPVFTAWPYLSAVTAVILLLVLIPLFAVQPVSGQVLAYISIDINPSLELTVSEKGRVLSVVGLNPEGAELAKEVPTHKPLSRVMETITSLAVEKGYLSANKENHLIIAGVPAMEEQLPLAELMISQAQKAADETLVRKNVVADVATLEAPPTIRENAKAEGLSTGKYIILLKANDAGLPLTPEMLKRENVVAAIREAGGNPGEIIGQAHQDKQVEKAEKKWQEKKQKGQGKPFGGDTLNKPKDQPGKPENPPKPVKPAEPPKTPGNNYPQSNKPGKTGDNSQGHNGNGNVPTTSPGQERHEMNPSQPPGDQPPGDGSPSGDEQDGRGKGEHGPKEKPEHDKPRGNGPK